MTADQWDAELHVLAIRYCNCGFGPDLAALTLTGEWGLHRYLLDMARGDRDAG